MSVRAALISQEAQVHCTAAVAGASKLNVEDAPDAANVLNPPKPFRIAALLNASPVRSLDTIEPDGAAQSVPPQNPQLPDCSLVKPVVVRLFVVLAPLLLAPIGSTLSAPSSSQILFPVRVSDPVELLFVVVEVITVLVMPAGQTATSMNTPPGWPELKFAKAARCQVRADTEFVTTQVTVPVVLEFACEMQTRIDFANGEYAAEAAAAALRLTRAVEPRSEIGIRSPSRIQ